MLTRPLDQRVREHKYRCAQTLVFGIPVIGLQYFGQQLGGAESTRWVAIMQVVLTGWILFVGATGMVTEGAMLIVAKRKLSGDFVVALVSAALFVMSCINAARGAARWFHVVVFILAAWSFVQWLRARSALRVVSATAETTTTPRSGSAAESEA